MFKSMKTSEGGEKERRKRQRRKEGWKEEEEREEGPYLPIPKTRVCQGN